MKIQMLNAISKTVIEQMADENYTFYEELENPDAYLVRSFKMHDMDIPESVLAIARAGAGTNNIPVEKCSEKGIVVFNTPGANANAVKELVLAAMLISSRNLIPGHQWTQSLHSGAQIPADVEKGKKQFAGTEIAGKKLGVIGLGAIGALVANSALDLEMEVFGYDPYISVETAWKISKNVKRVNTIEEIFETCDYVTCHVPLLDSTKEFVNAELLSKTKKGLILLNFSRGELVDEDALEYAISRKIIKQYITDFPNERILKMKHVTAFPHLGASTAEAEENCARMAIKQLKHYLSRGSIRNSVNFPTLELPPILHKRVTIVHENIPNMIGQISTLFAQSNTNIENLFNKSRGKWAYTAIDIETDIDDALIAQLRTIPGIVFVRVI